MKKIITTAMMLISVSHGFNASAETDYFFGGSIGSSNLRYTVKDNFMEYSDNEGSTEMSFRAGSDFLNNYRAYASFTKNEFDDVQQSSLKINGDRLFPLDNIVSIYAGVSAGTASFEGESYVVKGLTFGIQFGALIKLSEHVSVEGGWSYDMTSASNKYSNSADMSPYKNKLLFEQVSTAKFGANYTF
jgi:opacity protein-like surface antigen